MLRDAVDGYFQPARGRRRGAQLRQLFRVGRVSLLIGLAFLAAAIVIGEFVAGLVGKASYGGIIKESFVIGGWVALWRPLEIFLYDWWPIRARRGSSIAWARWTCACSARRRRRRRSGAAP